ncbi:2' O-ribose methyltransferase [Podospora pseudopauciseta]|uniref:rRNA methyltransferase 2, mitochondrial n=1 Tax=Podospora pseudopauciseta TaxID=2093780 RepID=A0ABR0HC00_9PEZI|nr:2' O-ribose methyltransferase [Podospora pseudopauciseta]
MSLSCRRASLWLAAAVRPVNRTLLSLSPSPSPSPSSSFFRPTFTTPSPNNNPQSRPSSSSSQWKQRQSRDRFALAARVQGLRSRAAFKLLEMQEKYSLFRPRRNQIVVDLGYAPGSWSQVALDATAPDGKVIGIDLLPAQPPKGVSTIQGNFLSKAVQEMCKNFVLEADLKRRKMERRREWAAKKSIEIEEGEVEERGSYIDLERRSAQEEEELEQEKGLNMRVVDVVLSDMSEPWPQTQGFKINSISNPYLSLHRLMNTSGISLRDHAGSMELCKAALTFASETLKPDGHFVCKYYEGSGDDELKMVLKKMFAKVHREKPMSSRKESRETFYVALRRREDVTFERVDGMYKILQNGEVVCGIV